MIFVGGGSGLGVSHSVVGEEAFQPFRCKVGFEEFAVGAGQVNDDETIEAISEIIIDVKGDELTVQLEVVFEKCGDPLAVVFDFRDECGDILNVADGMQKGFFLIPAQRHASAWRMLGFDEVAEGFIRAVFAQEFDDQVFRNGMVFAADADRAEEGFVTGVEDDEVSDSAPE